MSGVDTFYLLFAGALVYFMQIGFAMLCAGSIREKNVKNILLWCLLDSSGGAFGFWSIGYALAYGGDNNTLNKTFVGNSGFFLATSDIDLAFWYAFKITPLVFCSVLCYVMFTLSHPSHIIRFFQYTFATAVSSIVAGAIAERTKMEAYLTYSIFLCGFVYPVCAHAFWSQNGFLSAFAKDPLWGTGVIDLAGSGPVHLCGGAAALVMAVILGPRKGRFYDDHGKPLEEPKSMGPHSVLLQVSTIHPCVKYCTCDVLFLKITLTFILL
jgi:Amt family ammonium transporter